MPQHNKYMLISDFCKSHDIKTYRFYEMLNRTPELARKIKSCVLLFREKMKNSKVEDFKKSKKTKRRIFQMVYFKKNGNQTEGDFCDFDVPELEGIFIIGDLEGDEKMKKRRKVGRVIAVISAVCAAAAGAVFVIGHFAKKQKA